jgi:subunit length determinant Wzz-like protein
LSAVLDTTTDETARRVPDRGDGVHRTHRSTDEGPGLRVYVSALRRWWWLALLVLLLVLGVSIGSLFVIDPVYRSEAQVLLRTEDSRQLFPRTTGGALVRTPAGELLYAQSDEFEALAQEAAGDDAEVEVRTAPELSALVFVAEAGGPEQARAAAQTWAETYVTARQTADADATIRLRDLLVGDRDALNARRVEILAPVAALDEAVATETDPTELSRLLNQRLAIQRGLAGELDPLEAQIRQLNTQITGLEVDLRVLGSDPEALAYVSSAAELPEERANGSMRRSVLVGLVAGGVLAAGAVAAAQALRPRRR